MSNRIGHILDKFSLFLADIVEKETLQKRMERTIRTFIHLAIRVLMLLFIFLVFSSIGPAIETRYFGVAHSWRAENFKVVNGNWTFDVYAIKPWWRGNCEYLPDQKVNAVAFPPVGVRERSIDGNIRFLNNDNENSFRGVTRPAAAQEQYFGTWEFQAKRLASIGYNIIGRVHHRCHWLWTTTTNPGPFTITVEPSQ